MESIKIHQFINEAEGRRIINMINAKEGCNIAVPLIHNGDNWYIVASDITEKYLGKGV
jgi:hypothetical protein